jgi:glutathione S-transferase
MHADTAEIGDRNSADAARRNPAKRAGAKFRWMTIADLDGRTLACRRAHSLVREIENGLPPDQLTACTRQLVQRAAVIGTYIESCEAQWLSGEGIELADYLMAVNAQRRVLATIPGAMSRATHVVTSLAETLAKLDSEQVILENEEAAE